MQEMDTRRSSVESVDDVQATSTKMLVTLANDYSLYLKTDLSEQISKVEEFLEESVAKLHEFESLFEMKNNEMKSWMEIVAPDLIRTASLLSVTLNQRLDTLGSLLVSITAALDTLEAEVQVVEQKLGIHPSPMLSSYSASSSTLKSVFKYFIRTEDVLASEETPYGCESSNNFVRRPNLTDLRTSDDPLQLSQFFHN